MSVEKESYINKVIKNVLSVKKEQLEKFYNNIKEADAWIILGEGRSEGAIRIGLGQINKTIITMEDVDFPGRNIIEAAPVLEEKFKKIALIANSGSGETTFVKQVVRELADYIKETRSEKFTINVVTSKLESTLAKYGREFGSLVELKGREEYSSEDPSQEGIMNDIYELGSMLLFRKIKEGFNEDKDYKTVFLKMEEEARVIRKIIDDFAKSDTYQDILKKMETRARVVVGGRGPARNVAKMTAIRLQHVKKVMGGNAHLAGPFAPKTQPGDVLILISWSGENETILEWAREQKRDGGYVYSIVGNESSLSRESQGFIIDAPPEIFYERAAFVLSPLPLHLLERIHKRGGKIPDWLHRWFTHTKFE